VDPSQPPRLSDRGVSSVQFLIASGLGLVFFLALANIVVVQYGRGALRSALDQGVRVGSVSQSTERCEQRIDEVLGQLLGGSMGDGVTAECEISAGVVAASASAVFPSWTPFSADFEVEMTALATLEAPG
jgi:hypothetical protein